MLKTLNIHICDPFVLPVAAEKLLALHRPNPNPYERPHFISLRENGVSISITAAGSSS